MTESGLHRSMKAIVKAELESEDYQVMTEPAFPPANWIHWESYRPDLLGLRSDETSESLVIAECETNPSMRRFNAKRYGSLWFEPSVLREGSIRRILAVPRGKLSALDLTLRRGWEIWVIGKTGPMLKIPTVG